MATRYVSFRDELERARCDGRLEKTAILNPLGAIAGPVGHFMVNAAGMSAHNTNLADVLAHYGLQHGLSGSAISPGAVRSLHMLAGPESLNAYHAARTAGERLSGLNPQLRQAALSGMASLERIRPTSTGMDITHAPVLGPLQRAALHEVEGTTPKLDTSKASLLGKAYARGVDLLRRVVQRPFDTPLQKGVKNIVGGAPLAAAIVEDPIAMAAHGGFNAIREQVGRSAFGKNFMKKQLKQGLEGVPMSSAGETAWNYVVSPAVLDPRRIGTAIRGTVGPLPSQELARRIP